MQSSQVISTSDGRDLAFCEWGVSDGAPVFVLHGTPGSRYLRHIGGLYERQSVRAVTYDRPGYGGSTRLLARNAAQSAVDIETIADHLGLREFAVLGISGGGPSALAAAAAMPGRVIRCATHVGNGPFDAPDLDPLEGMSQEAREEYACAKQGEACLAGAFYQKTIAWAQALTTSQDFPAAEREMFTATLEEALRTPWGMVDDYLAAIGPWGFDIGDVVAPTTVMFAREDNQVPPAHGHWLVAHLPNAEPWIVDGGHMTPRDDLEESLLGWLASGTLPAKWIPPAKICTSRLRRLDAGSRRSGTRYERQSYSPETTSMRRPGQSRFQWTPALSVNRSSRPRCSGARSPCVLNSC
jgi:pimeloyl-ACP methyl ester carboxylesterase